MEKWYVDGDGDDMKASDARFKKNISTIDDALSRVTQLRGTTYQWKASQEEIDKKSKSQHELNYGVIAQEVRKILPELVQENKDGHLFVDYKGLIPVLIEAIKEQQDQIETIHASHAERIDGLSREVEELRTIILKELKANRNQATN